MRFGHKGQTRNRITMCQEGPVAITKVETPDLHGLVSTSSGNDGVVICHVHGEDWEFVTVELKEESQAVFEKHPNS